MRFEMGMQLGIFLVFISICTGITVTQTPEEITTNATTIPQQQVVTTYATNATTATTQTTETTPILANNTIPFRTQQFIPKKNYTTPIQPSLLSKILKLIAIPVYAVLRAPKVLHVLRNVGICVVNGMMDIITYYLPAPLIPLITSAAGQMIPFEPILMLKDKMPVASYRRAFLSAIRSFLGTFDKYKVEDTFDDDPYMMNQFNRRIMRYSSEETKKSKKKWN